MDLYRAERDTKIRARHLSALEDGEYEQLPGSVYAKGFLRNYALYLGLDPEELLSKWRDEQEPANRSEAVIMVRPPQPLAEPGRRLTVTPGLLVAGILSVVVLLFAAYVGMQLLRFSQAAMLTVEGNPIVQLGPDDTTTTFRGGSAAGSTINVLDGAGVIVKSVTSGADGHWELVIPVTKGQNEFSVVARDPVTLKESDPHPVYVLVPLPGTPAPRSTPTPATGATLAPTATLGAQATMLPVGSPVPASVVPAGAASLSLSAPLEGASVSGPTVAVHGSSGARSVRVSAAYAGTDATAPTPPEPVTLSVTGGTFSGSIDVPPGRWTILVRTVTSHGDAGSAQNSTVDVAYGGLIVKIEARGGSAWIQVAIDGQPADPGHTYHRGDSETFQAKHSIVIRTANGSTTAVTVNGEPKGTLGSKASAGTWVIDKGKEPRAQP